MPSRRYRAWICGALTSFAGNDCWYPAYCSAPWFRRTALVRFTHGIQERTDSLRLFIVALALSIAFNIGFMVTIGRPNKAPHRGAAPQRRLAIGRSRRAAHGGSLDMKALIIAFLLFLPAGL